MTKNFTPNNFFVSVLGITTTVTVAATTTTRLHCLPPPFREEGVGGRSTARPGTISPPTGPG